MVDQIKFINTYPSKSALAKISSIEKSVGGIIPNVSIDLKHIDNNLNVFSLGRIGNDQNGHFILDVLKSHGIQTSSMIVDNDHPTGFTDVMTSVNGERTFFTYNGANSYLNETDILKNIDDSVNFIHIGYVLLLGYLDTKDDVYGTKLAKLLHDIKEKNPRVQISLDMVSSNDVDAKDIVLPALKYIDYLIINELELSMITTTNANSDICCDNVNLMKKHIEILAKFQNIKKIVVHCPKINICYDRNDGFSLMNSFKLPCGYIKNAVGAGDAFAAGVIYGILNCFDNNTILKIACGSAISNLSASDSISGATSYENIIELIKRYGGSYDK